MCCCFYKASQAAETASSPARFPGFTEVLTVGIKKLLCCKTWGFHSCHEPHPTKLAASPEGCVWAGQERVPRRRHSLEQWLLQLLWVTVFSGQGWQRVLVLCAGEEERPEGRPLPPPPLAGGCQGRVVAGCSYTAAAESPALTAACSSGSRGSLPWGKGLLVSNLGG